MLHSLLISPLMAHPAAHDGQLPPSFCDGLGAFQGRCFGLGPNPLL